ncbi:hypothetical protein evm_007310 [Chilo suppressalis]|nr:hypothetical protein evm_007310 [Chilo suppressalis]
MFDMFGQSYKDELIGLKVLTIIFTSLLTSPLLRHRPSLWMEKEDWAMTHHAGPNGFVLSYMDVWATVAAEGEVDFRLVRGSTGSKSMVFQLVSNNSDFLSFQYLAYGMKEEEYKKIANVITLPINRSPKIDIETYAFMSILILYSFLIIV